MERIIESQIKQPVSYKRTVTLPREVMSVLGVGPRDNVVFQVKRGEVRLLRSFTVPTNRMPINGRILARSDNLKLPGNIKVEYEVQRVIKKSV
jgi:hypothetical protein